MLEKSPGFNLKPELTKEEKAKKARRSEAAHKGAETRALNRRVAESIAETDRLVAKNVMAARKVRMAAERQRTAKLQSTLAPGIAKALGVTSGGEDAEDRKAQRAARLSAPMDMGGVTEWLKAEIEGVRAGAAGDLAAIQEKARAGEATVRENIRNREEEWSDALDREGEERSKELDRKGEPEEYIPRHFGTGAKPGYAPHEEAKRKVGFKTRLSRAFKAFLKILREE